MKKIIRLRNENREHLFDQIAESASMTQCPYYRGIGICNQGCWEEPICITNGPFDIPTSREKSYLRKWADWYNKYRM